MLRSVVRQFLRQPAFWSAVILTLVVGTSTTTAVFAIVNGIVLRPLAYPGADRLVTGDGFGYKGEYLELRQRSRTLTLGAFMTPAAVSMLGADDPLRLESARVDAAYFDVLRLDAAVGRRFTDDDGAPDAVPVVILSDGLWRRRFGAGTPVLGSSISIDSTPHVIVGVMPPGTHVPSGVELWLPLAVNPNDRIGLWSTSARIVGRLRDGVSLDDARRELHSLLPTFRPLFPWLMPADYGQRATLVPLRDAVVGDVRPTLLVIFGAIATVLLILCVNVANLLLSRGVARERELAIRAALGATRTRLIRQLLLESLIASAVAGLLSVAVATALIEMTIPFLPADLPRVDDIVIDARVTAFAAALSFVTGMLFGTLPAFRGAAASRDFSPLRTTNCALQPSERRIGRVLATAEFALAALLVVTSALLARSLWSLLAVDPGFNPERLVTASVAPPRARYPNVIARRQFVDAVVERLQHSPGVRAAAVANALPFAGPTYSSVFAIEGRPDPARETGDWPGADVRAVVTPDYFKTLGVPVVEGRLFSPADSADTPAVTVVSRSLARRYWGEGTALNARIRFPGNTSRWLTVIGIVDDVKWHSLGEEQGQFPPGRTRFMSTLYVPVAQSDLDGLCVVVRTERNPQLHAGELRRLVQTLDAQTPVDEIATVEALMATSAARPRFTATLLSAFALASLLLAAIGVYGVLAYAVRRRTQEFAIRAAVGATAAMILGGVLREGVRLTLLGTGIGLAGAAATSRTVAALLPGTNDHLDPSVVVPVALVLVTTGLLASYLPARRATRISPLLALRSE